MNIHSLAKTTPTSRLFLVRQVLIMKRSVVEVAQAMGISVRTVYKWIARFRSEDMPGLHDRSSRPHSCPGKLPEHLGDQIVELRNSKTADGKAAWPSAREIAELLSIARSTVSRFLKVNNLSSQPKHVSEPVVRYEHEKPGDMLHIDCKKLPRILAAGHRVTGNPADRTRGGGYEVLYVCIDDNSRSNYEELLPDEKAVTAEGFIRRAVAFYERCGIEVKQILTDNGPCFKSAIVVQTCKDLGIRLRKTRPYRPQTNGKAERYIRTVLQGCLYKYRFNTSQERKEELGRWTIHYNLHRNHSAIGNRPPVSRLPALNNVLGNYN
jgi:transposase InsO family protein